MYTKRIYKDTVFARVFNDPKNLLALYNALNHSDYTDTDGLEITTADNAIYMTHKNDASFVFDSYLTLLEQQSTFNPNMPVRGLIYYAQQYNRIFSSRNYSLYAKNPVKLPTPQYYVFYNGPDREKDIEQLYLSKSFIHPDTSGAYEWTATMININAGHNKELLDACRPLFEYSEFINITKEKLKMCHDRTEALNQVIDECIERNILKDLLIKERASIVDSILTYYDEEETMRILQKEAKEDGYEEGREEGREVGMKEGREAGMKEGREAGMKEGELQTKVALVQKFVASQTMSLSEALSFVELEEAVYKKYAEKEHEKAESSTDENTNS